MTNKKLIDNEIVKELERYSDVSDSDITTTCFKTRLLKEIYLFINRLQADKSALVEHLKKARRQLKTAKVEAYKEFAEELLETKFKHGNDYIIYAENIYTILKEKVGEK